MQGILESINNDNSISIKTPTNSELEKISYDYLVLCTGSSYKEPIKDSEIHT